VNHHECRTDPASDRRSRPHKRALSALSPSRIHELIRKRFLRDYAHNTALALLSSAFDEKFLREILSSVPDPNSLDPNAGAGLGEQALPLFVSYKQEYVRKGVSAAKTPADYGGTPQTEPNPSAKGKRKGRTNEDEEHILTLDLEDIPELAALYPGMRALSFYAVDPDSGAYWEKARLTAIPMGSAPPTDGSPVAVLPLEVPAAVFDTDESREDVVLKDIRNLVFNRPGYALGEPMYIQGDEEGEGRGTFLFQLSESMGGLNLGDCGSLYVFTGGSFMQCY